MFNHSLLGIDAKTALVAEFTKPMDSDKTSLVVGKESQISTADRNSRRGTIQKLKEPSKDLKVLSKNEKQSEAAHVNLKPTNKELLTQLIDQ